MSDVFVVRKLDIDEPWFYVVDLRVEGAALISPASVVDRYLSRAAAKERAARLNADA